MRQSKLLSAVLSIFTAVFILTASIAVPILLRPFYYAHIDLLDLEETTGLSRAQITQAYDEMMDFCVGRTDTFSAGILPWSQSGRDHFADVRTLFLLDLRAALLSGLFLLGWTLVRNRSSVHPYRFMKRGFSFWGSVGLGGTFLVIGALAATNFSGAFTLFHTLFFPGKSNWLFDPYTDPIICLLPQEFFRNCAIFILLLMVLLCTLAILFDLRKK
ncbi:MAG: TIGR01906 family membrane protein [Ruminococcaceae bacterium]|nr:TIGR01906 family membrane protein [Oscillospiraceae bacterium]